MPNRDIVNIILTKVKCKSDNPKALAIGYKFELKLEWKIK